MRCVTLRKLLFWAPVSLSVRDSISPYVIGIKRVSRHVMELALCQGRRMVPGGLGEDFTG